LFRSRILAQRVTIKFLLLVHKTAHHLIKFALPVLKTQQLLLQVIDGAVQVIATFIEAAESLVATRLIVENDDDHVAINILAFIRVFLEDDLGLLERFQRLLSFLRFQM
jgi:hypothetical protein